MAKKIISGKSVKKLASKVAVESMKKARKKKKPKTPLYTDEERALMRSLSRKKSVYKKKAMDAYKSFEIDNLAVSMQDIRNTMSDDDARECYYQGYFDEDEDTYNDYKTKDFRSWMLERGDSDLLTNVLSTYEATTGIDLSDEVNDMYAEQEITAREYLEKYNELEAEMKEIRKGAKDRQTIRKGQELAHKNALKNGESLIETLDKFDMNKLSKPEKALVNDLKGLFANAVITGMKPNLQQMSEIDRHILTKTVAAAIMKNPLEGFRTALKESVAADVAKQYGRDGADLAGSLVDLMTGKGSIKALAKTGFEIGVRHSNWNPELVEEKAQELIDMGKSTKDQENIKQLGRDVALDIAKDVILSGGQLYAAIPMALKDIFFDIGKAGVRHISQKD